VIKRLGVGRGVGTIGIWVGLLVAGCGGGGGGGGGTPGTGGGMEPTGGGSTTGNLHPPWKELAMPAISVQGGSASSPGGVGQQGGTVHLVAQGDVSIDESPATITEPDVPAAPGDALALGMDALAADASAPGAMRISGKLTAGGGDPIRTLSAGGDIFVDGTLRGADLGGARQGIALSAPNGTVYVSGAIDTSGADGGQAGGVINITAQRVVVTGKLLASGGDGASTAGAAGAITLVSTAGVISTGTIEAFGGFAKGDGAVTGGAAADLAIRAGGDVALAGAIRLRGGAAETSGVTAANAGAAATLRIDTTGAVMIGGVVDARGGIATAATGGAVAAGGAAGVLRIGEKTVPTQISIGRSVIASGGDGDMVGGAGGTFTPEPKAGNANFNGTVDVSGGSSLATPGPGGTVEGGPTTDPGSGGVFVGGTISVDGGSIRQGGAGNGADAGRVTFEMIPTLGPATILASGTITADGGASGGRGTAGGGGHVWIFTKDADVTLAGKISVRGGQAPDDGGTGGLGGMVYFFSDNNHNALESSLGNILVDTTGVIDASGGDGTIGGSARNHPGGWPVFPEEQEEIAIFFNCDGVHGETRNWMENRGHLIARGGVHNGDGGDIVYHGIGPGQLGTPVEPGQSQHHPPSGNIDNAGDGSGTHGDFAGE
jgi:hypothetical protein